MKPGPMAKALTFGGLISNFYHTCGKQRATGILRLAVEAHLVEFRGRDVYVLGRRTGKL